MLRDARLQTESRGTTPATAVLFDFEATLLAELAARGLDYRVAGRIQNTDVELPMIKPGPAFDDVRVTDYDAVLARGDVQISNVLEKNFAVALPAGPITVLRGFVAVDATVNGRTYRFVNTHLEPFSLDVQLAQASELLADLHSETRPVIAVGDFNTPAPAGATYGVLRTNGYLDVWDHRPQPAEPGLTCCHVADLSNVTPALSSRIDLILVRNAESLGPRSGLFLVQADVVGEETRDRTESGLWPSDHAGVVPRLQLPRPGPLASQ